MQVRPSHLQQHHKPRLATHPHRLTEAGDLPRDREMSVLVATHASSGAGAEVGPGVAHVSNGSPGAGPGATHVASSGAAGVAVSRGSRAAGQASSTPHHTSMLDTGLLSLPTSGLGCADSPGTGTSVSSHGASATASPGWSSSPRGISVTPSSSHGASGALHSGSG